MSTPYRQDKKDARRSQPARQPSSTPPASHPQAASNTTKDAQQRLDGRIPSPPATAEDRKLYRELAVKRNLNRPPGCKSKLRYVRDDHECFRLDSVQKFCEDYEIKMDGNPFKNFKRLLSGCQDLPFILLQNPTKDHIYDYDTMKKCPTIQWISDVLTETGLTLEDVVIVDICSLLSDDDLDQLGKEDPQRKYDAMERSFEMVGDILRLLRPSVLVSCQCKTGAGWNRWGRRMVRTDNALAKSLCSNESAAKMGLTRTAHIGSHDLLLAYGVHPCRLLHEESMAPVLRGIFEDVFEPCMTWFKEKREEESLDAEDRDEPKEVRRRPDITIKDEKSSRKSPMVELGEQLSAMKIQEVNK